MNTITVNKKNIKLNDFTVFASLPDMGMVGGIVSDFLIKELDAEPIAEIKIFEKPWVKCKNGLITTISEQYNIFANTDKKIIIMNGKSQPQDPLNLFNLIDNLLKMIKNIGKPKIIYTSGGYYQPKLVESPRAYGVFNNENMKNYLLNSKIDILDNEIENITWFNGVLLGMATENNIDSVGLFGEISDINERQPLAAKAIIKAFSILENISFNTEQLDRDYENEVLKNTKNKDKDKDRNKYGPGIG